MTFEELRDFITSKMKMSHIYQPLLISPLLILVEYQPSDNEQQPSFPQMKVKSSYEKLLKEMPINVLPKHEVITRGEELISLTTKKADP